jgi:hypothetical protein
MSETPLHGIVDLEPVTQFRASKLADHHRSLVLALQISTNRR